MSEHKIESLEQYIQLWKDIHASDGGPRWDHILPYYHEDIIFQDSVQKLQGIKEFTAMTDRLKKRSKNFDVVVHNSGINENVIFVEWELIISYKRFPSSSIFGASRTTLKDGKIVNQRDYYDLWGDIYDNIPFFRRFYRWFMRKVFG
jgi:limonene-1,2-epoxide hydrolase